MVFPSNFESKIGFDAIRTLLKDSCLGPGRSHAEAVAFSDDLTVIRPLLEQTEEMRHILVSQETFPSQDYYDLTDELHRIRIEGTFIEPENLSLLKLSLSSISLILDFFRKHPAEQFPYLTSLSGDISIEPGLIHDIDRIVDEKSQVRDDASTNLKKIRKEKKAKLAAVERKIVQSLKLARQSGWTPENAELTLRDGRLVIPLLHTHKRKIQGFVHDESATGQTVYLEPADVLETNNEIRELDYAERREIIHILTAFADTLRPFCEELTEAYTFLGTIDFIRAKASFALRINGVLPATLSEKPRIAWNDAVHPLLYIAHSRQKKSVVPLSMELDPENRILVISGPNAGGKSVCLKTVGLLQYMVQCGILPSAKEDSAFGIFRNIFIDIGDEQSLENDLSTYTSKLLNLKFFLENLDENSLFLIDEFGTGTDPALGGPIAEASLEEINRRKAFGVVTTHYSNLKLLAGRIEGIVNGAMLYDASRMKPLYLLKTGKPGSSFAFEIARQIGFPEDVLDSAARKTGTSQLDFDRELQNLEVEKTELVQKSTEVRVADDFLNEMITKYRKLNEELEKSKKEILQKAKEEALEILDSSNRIIEKTIKEIRESQAEKEKTKEVRLEIRELKNKIEQDTGTPVPEKPKEKKFTRVNPEELGGKSVRSPYQSFYDDLQRKLMHFELTLDLRGKRADETFSILQHYIDDAILLNIPEVRILHGKGNGVLRQITRDYLSTVKEVKKFSDEAIERGGAGITVVVFR
ncbi:MAG: Smr/MutS family protein [Bacteroidetes bacterium]|nr:Smr/MutS family protein [Bacteroidota bacterium]